MVKVVKVKMVKMNLDSVILLTIIKYNILYIVADFDNSRLILTNDQNDHLDRNRLLTFSVNKAESIRRPQRDCCTFASSINEIGYGNLAN